MNKEFKFWCKGTSSNPNFNKKGWWTFPNYLLSKYYGGLSIFESEDFVSCQSTGLTDSTGKKIFEGDIVLFQEKYKYQIYWLDVDASFDLALIHDDESFFHMPTFRCGSALQMKVIGNIFETPELLK